MVWRGSYARRHRRVALLVNFLLLCALVLPVVGVSAPILTLEKFYSYVFGTSVLLTMGLSGWIGRQAQG